MAIQLTLTIVLLMFTTFNNAQKMLPQCSCRVVQSCKQKMLANLFPCSDQCKKYVTSLGANYKAIRDCITQNSAQIEATINCMERAFPNACAKGAPRMLPKRYQAGFEIALASEANRVVQATGLQRQLAPMLGTAKKMGQCVFSCISKRTQCGDLKRCSLDLPSDTQLVATGKQCAMQSGFLTTATMQKLCNCAVNAGIRQLQNVCPAIRIF